jgi:magnesium chelatase family protein
MPNIVTAAILGIHAEPVYIETDISYGIGCFTLVGLPDTAVKEARDRIRSAIRNAGFTFPRTRVTVNLAPADRKKQGPSFDLPIALSILAAQGTIPQNATMNALFLGELGLDATIRPVAGVLSAALMAKRLGIGNIYVPCLNAQEAAHVSAVATRAPGNLGELITHLLGDTPLPEIQPLPQKTPYTSSVDFAHIRGQAHAKRGLEIAAAGGHNVLLKGPPGTGKTLLARAIPSILPPLSQDESLEATAIASIAGVLPTGVGLLQERPFRSPHHSCSAPSLIGGGSHPRPGEVSLAHRGVLFLDELPEFSRHVLEHLRQPLEDGEVTVARASATLRFPCRFILVAAMNPCPCGYATDPKRPCVCLERTKTMYLKRLSGPLLDRFDLVIEVPNLDPSVLIEAPEGEPSSLVRQRVAAARSLQAERFANKGRTTNAEISSAELSRWCKPNTEGNTLLQQALAANHLSVRGWSRVLKVARTIADLEAHPEIQAPHIAEALRYRLTE